MIFTPANTGNGTTEQCRVLNNVWRVLKWRDTPQHRLKIISRFYAGMSAVELFRECKATTVENTDE